VQRHACKCDFSLMLNLELRRLLSVRYPKGSKPRHYIFMWIVGVRKVEIHQLPYPGCALRDLTAFRLQRSATRLVKLNSGCSLPCIFKDLRIIAWL